MASFCPCASTRLNSRIAVASASTYCHKGSPNFVRPLILRSEWKLGLNVVEDVGASQRRTVQVASMTGKESPDRGEGAKTAVLDFDISRLEAYTERVRSEVLSINALVDDEEDQVIVFKGFSSSLSRPTPDDPSEPVLPPGAIIHSIDRIRGPYNPSKVQYIQQGMTWEDFQLVLHERGL